MAANQTNGVHNARNQVIPDVCHFHQMESKCLNEDTCRYIHLCDFFIRSKCAYGQRCTKSHDLSEKDEKILRAHGLKGSKKEILDQYIRDKSAAGRTSTQRSSSTHRNSGALTMRGVGRTGSSSARSHSRPAPIGFSLAGAQSGAVVRKEPSTKIICTHYLDDQCKFGDGCDKIHPKGKRPFVWRYRKTIGSESSWEQFDPNTNVLLEEAFCDPSQSYCRVKLQDTDIHIDLRRKKSMDSSDPIEVERLVTLDIDKGWKWYMEYPAGTSKWLDLSESLLNTGVQTIINSEYLEETYKQAKKLNSTGQIVKFCFRDAVSNWWLDLSIKTKYDAPEMAAVTNDRNTGPESSFKVERRPVKNHLVAVGRTEQEICTYHPVKPCESPKCPMKGYQAADTLWVYKESRDSRWKHFKVDLGKQLEREFSLPGVSTSTVVTDENLRLELTLNDRSDFESVTVVPSNYQVRRLSYSHPNSTAFSSYTWFWEADICQERYAQLLAMSDRTDNAAAKVKLLSHVYNGYTWWIQFGGMSGTSSASSTSVSGQRVEQMFQVVSGQESGLQNSSSNFKGDMLRLGLNFEQMVRNVSDSKGNNIRQRVRRRLDCGVQKRKEAELELPVFIPVTWARDIASCCSVKLDERDKEYMLVKNCIMHQNKQNEQQRCTITGIERIENKQLWGQFWNRKLSLQQEVSDGRIGSTNECILFFPLKQPISSQKQIEEKGFAADELRKYPIYNQQVAGRESKSGFLFLGEGNVAIRESLKVHKKGHLIVALACLGDHMKPKQNCVNFGSPPLIPPRPSHLLLPPRPNPPLRPRNHPLLPPPPVQTEMANRSNCMLESIKDRVREFELRSQQGTITTPDPRQQQSASSSSSSSFSSSSFVIPAEVAVKSVYPAYLVTLTC